MERRSVRRVSRPGDMAPLPVRCGFPRARALLSACGIATRTATLAGQRLAQAVEARGPPNGLPNTIESPKRVPYRNFGTFRTAIWGLECLNSHAPTLYLAA